MDGLLCPECGCLDVVVYSSFGSAVIPCRGGPCGRPQPTLSTIISTKSSLHWLRTATGAAPCKGLIHFRNLSSL